jgi:methyl-accepting chemotaxis protein
VRTLAQSSAAAAGEIKKLIGDSVVQITAGDKLANEAGATMLEIVAGVKNVAQIMNDVMLASNEQSARIEQVSLAIGQMDEVTQQNAALVEDAAAAATELTNQAAGLSDTVSIFTLTSKNTSSGNHLVSSARQSAPDRQPGHAPLLVAT